MRLPHPEILNTLSVGDTLLLDDGKLRMVVTAKHDGAVDTVVEVRPALTHKDRVGRVVGASDGQAQLHYHARTHACLCKTVEHGLTAFLPARDVTWQIGGDLSNRKGVNTPSIVLPISPLTNKDRIGTFRPFFHPHGLIKAARRTPLPLPSS